MKSAMRVTLDESSRSRGAMPASVVPFPTPAPPPEFRFQSLLITDPKTAGHRSRASTAALSILIHMALAAAIVVLPLLFYDYLPAPGESVRAFFVAPPVVAPPPPPPPPPAPSAVRSIQRAPVAPRPVAEVQFVAPIEVPAEVQPEETLDLGGIEGGVPGGVEGGVPGGVLGGIVGGVLGGPEPPAPKAIVRIGGKLLAPKLVHRVEPEYPFLAIQARVKAILVLEAQVGTNGHVETVRILRGSPLFDEPALAAVRQWRYQPLLLNGVPTQFILTVTLIFNLTQPTS